MKRLPKWIWTGLIFLLVLILVSGGLITYFNGEINELKVKLDEVAAEKTQRTIIIEKITIEGETLFPGLILQGIDGKYDNSSTFVNPSEMKLSEMEKSIVGLNISGMTLGTGVVIGKYFLTLNHVASYNASLEKVYYLDGVYLGKIFFDKKNDVALFKIPEAEVKNFYSFPYELGNSDELEMGNFLYVLGHPTHLGIYGRSGEVTALSAFGELDKIIIEENSFMFSQVAFSGDSGGLIIAIRDGRYELVGLVQGMLVQSGGWGVRINEIVNLIKEKTGIDLRQEVAKANQPPHQ